MTAPLVPGAGQRAVDSTEEVLEQLPFPMRRQAVAPTRDAIVAGLFAILEQAQYRGDIAAAQADVGRATGVYLDAAGDERSVARGGATELDATYRPRVVGVPRLVTFDALRAAVNAILASWTAGACEIWDCQLDRWFVGDSTAGQGWHSFPDFGPNYPTRYLEGDAMAPVQLAGNDPRGAYTYDDTIGRMFQVAIPDLRGIEDLPSFPFDDVAIGTPPIVPESNGLGMYPGDSSNPLVAAFVLAEASSAEDIYAAIVAEVQRLKGFGIRWILNTDTRL